MSNEPENHLAQYKTALGRLKEALKKPKSVMRRDSGIMCFIFTYELTWKMMKRAAERGGLEVRSPRDAIRAAFRLGLIEDEPLWTETLDMRNAATHTYNEKLANDIYRKLPGVHKLYEKFLSRLKAEQ
jgi:nucleotidyltransferase substrate binding protein (TIGR01987 family)